MGFNLGGAAPPPVKLTGAVTTVSAVSGVTSLVSQYSTEQQDATGRGGTAGSGSVSSGTIAGAIIANPVLTVSSGTVTTLVVATNAIALQAIPGSVVSGPGIVGSPTVVSVAGTTITITNTGSAPTAGSFTFNVTGCTLAQLNGATLTFTSLPTVPSTNGPWFGLAANQKITVPTSTIATTITYVNATSTTLTGITSSGTNTITSGGVCSFPSMFIPDLYMGASITRGTGANFGPAGYTTNVGYGLTDWVTRLSNTENALAGLINNPYGFVPAYMQGGFGGILDWAVNSNEATNGTGSAIPVSTGSWTPMIAVGTFNITAASSAGGVATCSVSGSPYLAVGQTLNLGSGWTGGAGTMSDLNGTTVTVTSVIYTSFIIVTGFTFATTKTSPTVQTQTATVPSQMAANSIYLSSGGVISDNRTFRRAIIFFQNQASGDNVTFATTGVAKSSGTLATNNGTGISCWDSGDLGYYQAGTGISATWTAGGGGAGAVIIGVLYLQTAGNNGVVNFNVAIPGATTDTVANNMAPVGALMTFMANANAPFRRVFHGDQMGNDALFSVNTPAQAQANLVATTASILSYSPGSEPVMLGLYQLGSITPTLWASTWLPTAQAAAVQSGSTFIDLYAAFGNLGTGYDTYGMTSDNLHLANFNARTGRSGQQTLAEIIFNKLYYSRAFGSQNVGTITTGVAADGKITSVVGAGNFLANPVQAIYLYGNSGDANARAILWSSPNQILPSGIYLGPGGASATDSALTRTGAGIFKMGSALVMAGLSGATTSTRWAGGVAGGPPGVSANNNGFLPGDFVGSTLGGMWVCNGVGGSAGTITACSGTTDVTLTVASTSQLQVGQTVSISGMTGFATNPNGTWKVASISSATTFHVTVTTTIGAGAMTGTPTVGVWTQQQQAAWLPSDDGFLAETFDYALTSGTNLPTAGTMYMQGFNLRGGQTITNVCCIVTVLGATLTGSWVAIYDSAGTRQAVSTDQSSLFTSTGLKSVPLSSTYTPAPGYYFACILFNGGTPIPSLARGATGSGTKGVNGNRTAFTTRFGTGTTGITGAATAPTASGITITPSTDPYWVGLS